MRVIAIYPGRFHPFHKGHAASFKQLADSFGLENTYLALSEKQEQPKSPFAAGDRAKMAMALGIPKENIISVRNTYGADEYIKRFEAAGIDPNQTALIFGVSGKDMGADPRFSFAPKKDGSPSYLQPYGDELQPMTKHAYVVTTNVAEFPIAGQSMTDASQIRSAYVKGDDKMKAQILNDLYGKASKLIKPIFDKNLQLSESIYKKIVALKAKISEAKLVEGTAGDINKMFGNMYDPTYSALHRVALLAMQGRQDEAMGQLRRVINDASPEAQSKIIDAVNSIEPVTVNGRIADSSILDKSKQHQDWIKDTFIPWVEHCIKQQSVDEGIVLNPTDLIDIFVKGKHNKKTRTFPVAKGIPNRNLDQVIELLITKYNVNPNTIIYGPSKNNDVKEGEVLQFKRPAQRQLTYKDLPPRVLKLANDWFWQEEDSMGLDAVMDPKGFGSGPKNAMQHTSAILQTLGWKIGWDDEIENLILTNKKGQSVLLPSMDAYDFTGWAEGSNADLREADEPFNLPNRHPMDFTKRKFMIKQIAKATGWDISDIELASDEEIQQAYDEHVKSESYLEEN